MKLFENLPSTKTPINAENLNQIQDNLVVVSATEPTGDDREKVWIQKGKNLLNKSKVQNLFIALNSTSEALDYNAVAYTTEWIPCNPNTQYIISFADGKDDDKRRRWQSKDENGNITYVGESLLITTNATAKYIRCYFYYDSTESITSIPNVQIEQGSTATTYEAYIEPKIYVKNDNGVYEEFSSKEDTLERYATEEQVVGVWIDGKPIYRKVFSFKTSDNCDIDFKHNLSDLDKIWINEGKSFVFTDEEGKRETLVLNWYHDANTFTRCWINPWSIRFKAPFAFGVRTAYVTVEYTKTTS